MTAEKHPIPFDFWFSILASVGEQKGHGKRHEKKGAQQVGDRNERSKANWNNKDRYEMLKINKIIRQI